MHSRTIDQQRRCLIKSNFLAERIVACVGTAVLLSALAIPAAAVEPIKFSDTQTLARSIQCPDGITLNGSSTIHENGIVFLDASGNTTHEILHDTYDTSFIGPNGKIASGVTTQNETFNVNTGAFAARGLFLKLRVAGVGMVAHIAGQISTDSSGNVKVITRQLTNDDVSALCAALE
jgi:hypothetical protein